jgi:hypothetical protein
MLARFRPRLTFANVMSCVALFVALGGTSYAALSVGSGQIKDHSIKGVDIAQGSLTSENVKDRSLQGKDIGTGQLSARTIQDGAVTGQKVAAGSLTAEAIKKGSLTADVFMPGQLPAGPPGQPGDPGQPGQPGAVGPTTGVASTTSETQGVLSPNAPSSSTTIGLATKSKLLIQGVDNYSADCTGSSGSASIGLFLDDTFVPGSRRDLMLVSNQKSAGTLVTMGVVPNVSAGTHTVKVASTPGCVGSSGFDAIVSAVALGG